MALRYEDIKVVAYVRVDGVPVAVDDLPEERRIRLATELKLRYLNGLFRGRAEFYAAAEENQPGG